MANLPFHSVSHEERLVWIGGPQPIKWLDLIEGRYLHSHLLCVGRLALGSSAVGNRAHESIDKGRVCHGMLVSSACLEVLHHVCQPCLSCGLCPFLLDLVHLFKVLFRRLIQFLVDSFSWHGSSFTLGHVVHFKPTSKRRGHGSLAWSRHLLDAVQLYLVEVAGAVQIPFLVSHDLLKQVVSASLSLLLF